MTAIVRARVDAEGHLVQADAELAGLHARAGGAVGGPLAVPQLAALARLVRRIGAPVSRAVIAADGDADLELWVRARPDGDDVVLAIVGWSHREPAPPLPGTREAASFDRIRAEADWVWEVDATLRIVALPTAALDALGHAPGMPVVGEALTSVMALEDADAQGAGPPLLDALASGRDIDAQIVRARVSGRRYRLSGVALTDAAGRIRGFRGGAFAIGESSRENAAGAEADGGTARRFDAALRGPLGRIVSTAEAIRSAGDGPLRADYGGYADDIATAGRHLLALVDDLVDLDTVERGDLGILIEPVDMADLARRAAGLLAVRADDRRIRIVRPEEEERQPATGDFGRSLQVLVNIIGNAVRYGPEDSVVTVTVAARAAGAAVTVADEGRGIAAEDRERVFGKFERLGAREPGSGLGLYISRRLARAMGGDVAIEDGDGAGACFVFTLPAVTPPPV